MSESGTTPIDHSPIQVTQSTPTAGHVPDPKRWMALVAIAIAQLMVILDATIVTIALPQAQKALHISLVNRQWVVTIYALAFGGFLLLGGRIADYAGRKRVFIIGLIGFAGASALGGFAPTQGLLFAARGLQGLFAAALAPAALSLISVTFTDSKERARAFGVYGAVAGAGSAIGLLAGGLLTEYGSWRWCLFVNIPIALIAVALAIPNVRESRLTGGTKYDIPGALLSTLGLVSLVYGISEAATPGHGWGSARTLTFLVAGVVLLIAFVLYESKAKKPLLPLSVILDRVRGGSFLSQFFLFGGLFGMFLFMTYYFQGVHGFSPVKTGLYFFPFALGTIVGAGTSSQLLPRFGPRPLGAIGLFMASGGLFFLSRITYTSSYASSVLPAFIIVSLGMGMTVVAASATALFNVPFHESGVASAVLNSSQQIGGSLGIAISNTLAISATAAFALAHPWRGPSLPPGVNPPDALTHGFSVAFLWGSASLMIAGIIYLVMVNVDRHHLAQHDDVGEPETVEDALRLEGLLEG
jgi:EmrB/QacA subfamily drug resistance transporter